MLPLRWVFRRPDALRLSCSAGGGQLCVNLSLQVSEMVSMVTDPSTVQGPLPPIKPTPLIIQAAPTVYATPPAPVGLKRIDFRTQRQSRMVCVC